MSEQPAPTPEERDAPLERRIEEDAMRYPQHEDPPPPAGDDAQDEPETPAPTRRT